MTLKQRITAVAAVLVLAGSLVSISYAAGWYNAKPAAATETQIPACPTEDSGPNPCYWDASIHGNHMGTSFVRLNGQLYYADQAVAS